MLKRIKKILLCVLIALGCVATGCSSGEPVLNAARHPEKYHYDFMKYVDAKVYGPEGYGFLEIEPKELEVSDFKTEKEYIAIKKAMNVLKTIYDPDDPNAETNLVVSQGQGLSNGDIVTLSINPEFEGDLGGVDMCLEPFEFQVSGLKKGKKLDLFDSSSVSFLSLEDDDVIYPVKIYGGAVPDSVLDNIVYEAKTDDTKLETGTTILNVSATLIPIKDEDGNQMSTSLATWLGMRGYLAHTTDEKVLREVASTITFNTANQSRAAEALLKALKDEDENTLSVATIQQLLASDGSYDPYEYTITYYATPSREQGEESEEPVICKRANAKMGFGKDAGVSVLELESSGYSTDSQYCSAAFSGMELKALYTQETQLQSS